MTSHDGKTHDLSPCILSHFHNAGRQPNGQRVFAALRVTPRGCVRLVENCLPLDVCSPESSTLPEVNKTLRNE